jgi:DNA-binding response OmpR family regulator
MQIGVEASRAVENKRIFVVEPDEVTRAALQFMLHDENETHEIRDLETAYRKGRDSQPDLLLLGMGIVRKKGMTVLKEIKNMFPGAKLIPVAEADEALAVEEALRAGADAVLLKPLRVEAVRETVDRHLGRNGVSYGGELNPHSERNPRL